MRKFVMICCWVLAVFTIGVGIFVIAYWKHVQSFPGILSAYYAKEFCSCYYIVKKDDDFCHNVARQYIPISQFSHDREAKIVSVIGLGRSTSVRFVNDGYGCRYIEKTETQAHTDHEE